MGRSLALRLFRRRYDGPPLRGPLLNLEPRAQHPDFAVIHFDNCLQVIELDDAIPRAAAELQRDIGLQSRE